MGVCAWCSRPLPPGRRRDALTCSKACRQAKARFRVGKGPPGLPLLERPCRFAYADPPYPGLSRKYYGEDEVDHGMLVRRLTSSRYDGWALSTSAAALPKVLRLCPEDVRVSVWVKGARGSTARKARSAYEPVILWGGRPDAAEGLQELTDVLIAGGRPHSHPGALPGMKPAAFSEWVFRQLGARRGDELDDLFPRRFS